MKNTQLKKFVKKRYSELAKREASCCCLPSIDIGEMKGIGYSEEELRTVPKDAITLGCGNPVALASLKEREIILDLGSGMGLDCFLAASKVGEKGRVIGVDMTPEMVDRAKSTADKHGYKNVEFRLGEIENLPVEDSSVDVIISNCVINLSPDKEKVFREAYRVLKPSGRIMISDLVTEGELPEKIKKSPDKWAECIAGAIEKNVYLNMIRRAGFKKVKIVSEAPWDIDISEELKGKVTSMKVEATKQ